MPATGPIPSQTHTAPIPHSHNVRSGAIHAHLTSPRPHTTEAPFSLRLRHPWTTEWAGARLPPVARKARSKIMRRHAKASISCPEHPCLQTSAHFNPCKLIFLWEGSARYDGPAEYGSKWCRYMRSREVGGGEWMQDWRRGNFCAFWCWQGVARQKSAGVRGCGA